MTPEIHRAQVSAVYGCAKLLASHPDCQTASEKLMTIYRREQLKLCRKPEAVVQQQQPPLVPAFGFLRQYSWFFEFLGVLMFFATLYGLWMIGYAITGEMP